MSVLEESYHNSNSEDVLNTILKLKYDYNHILTDTVGNYIREIKQRLFELGNKT